MYRQQGAVVIEFPAVGSPIQDRELHCQETDSRGVLSECSCAARWVRPEGEAIREQSRLMGFGADVERCPAKEAFT